MNLHIIMRSSSHTLKLDSMSIAGKSIVEYWLEWARHKEYKQVYVYTREKEAMFAKLAEYEYLYGVRLTQRLHADMDAISKGDAVHYGFGVFLDNGRYENFANMDEVLAFERVCIQNPLKYCSVFGYGNKDNIQIGQNVYIHPSVKLSGNVIIGDNCSIEKDVSICDSVIDAACSIKQHSIIENSHIAKNIQMRRDIYLVNKALFFEAIYDCRTKNLLSHEGLCSVKKVS